MRYSNIKEFKVNQGFTNKQLEDMFHVTPEYISYLLNETRFPSRKLAKKREITGTPTLFSKKFAFHFASLFSVSTFVSILMLEFSAIYKYFQGNFNEENSLILSYIKDFQGKEWWHARRDLNPRPLDSKSLYLRGFK